ncbi:MAG TPA: VOC family protein [Candidatus Binatia bacterium]|nr:VOC family protein [Candidatus Binatia bacterium]
MGGNMKANGDVHHLDHFVVAVMNPDRAEKFYTEVLGARTLKYENAPNMTRVFMKLGENHVGLFSQGKATLPKREDANSYPRHSFQVPETEYDEMAAKIRRESSFVRDIKNEIGLGCFWNDGLVFQDSEGNFVEITKASGISKTRLHHLHFDTTDVKASVDFYTRFLNCTVQEQKNGMAAVAVPSGQCVILNEVNELSEVTKTTYRGRHFAFNVSNDNFHAIVEKLHAAGIEERDEHGEREGRRPEQLGTYFKEPSGFRLQITNEDSAEFARHAKD